MNFFKIKQEEKSYDIETIRKFTLYWKNMFMTSHFASRNCHVFPSDILKHKFRDMSRNAGSGEVGRFSENLLTILTNLVQFVNLCKFQAKLASLAKFPRLFTYNLSEYLNQADCALTNLTKICQNRQLHSTHDVICIKIASLTKFVNSAIFVTACISGHKCKFSTVLKCL